MKNLEIFIHANNPWWWPVKGPKILRTILIKKFLPIPTQTQDTYQETWKDLNKMI